MDGRGAAIVGCPVAEWDSDCHVFGRPLYWQCEGEYYTDPAGGGPAGDESGIMLFQDEFGEGHIHVWVESADAAKRDYSGCWVDYSGT